MELKNLKISLDVWTYRFKLPLKFFLELFWFKQQFDKVKKKKKKVNNPKQENAFLSSFLNSVQQISYSDSIYEVQQCKILLSINCPPVPDCKWYPISVLKREIWC